MSKLDVDARLAEQNQHAYALAIEHGNYRAAMTFAIRECRRDPGHAQLWRVRAFGAFRRRHQ